MRYFSENSQVKLPSQKAAKDRNLRRVFSMIAKEKNVSRASLARELRLTPSTISGLVEELISREFVLEYAVEETGAAGRKPVLLTVNPAGMRIPVFSLRHTGVQYTLLNGKLKPIERLFEPYQAANWRVETRNEYRDINPTEIADLARRIADRSRLDEDWDRTPAMCIELAGTFDWEQGTFSSTSINLRGSIAFIDMIRRLFRNIPVLVCSQTRASGYAELSASGTMNQDTLYIETGKGIGASVFLDGRCFVGSTDLAGEIGHITVDPNGPRCLCGNRGCLEKYASRDAILAQVCIEKGYDMTWEAVCAAYRGNDPKIAQIIHKSARYLIAGISNMICALNVRRVILGGDVVGLGNRFLEELKKLQCETSYRKGMSKAEISFAQLQENSEIDGIARLYQDRYYRFVR